MTLSLAAPALYVRTNNDQQFPPSLLGIMGGQPRRNHHRRHRFWTQADARQPAALAAILTDFTITLKS